MQRGIQICVLKIPHVVDPNFNCKIEGEIIFYIYIDVYSKHTKGTILRTKTGFITLKNRFYYFKKILLKLLLTR